MFFPWGKVKALSRKMDVYIPIGTLCICYMSYSLNSYALAPFKEFDYSSHGHVEPGGSSTPLNLGPVRENPYYLEGQGDVVSRLLTGMTGIFIRLTRVVSILTK